MKSGEGLNKSLYIYERRLRLQSALHFFKGLKKVKGWKKLAGFRNHHENFKKRVSIAKRSYFEFCLIIGDPNPTVSKYEKKNWQKECIKTLSFEAGYPSIINELPTLHRYTERGIIAPYLPIIQKRIQQLSAAAGIPIPALDVFLSSLLGSIEQLTRRAFILDLNIRELKADLDGANSSEKFNSFVQTFTKPANRLEFAKSYPVLTRQIVTKLSNWEGMCSEFFQRLTADRLELAESFGISINANLKTVSQSGDTHNSGRSVFIIEFDDLSKIVYKPRNVSLEEGFQKYIKYFNAYSTKLNLRCLNVLNRNEYGWVEFVNFEDQKNQEESESYHYKLGYLTALVYSLCGVDIFFENLVSAGSDPIIIDLEALFHTPIDFAIFDTPSQNLQIFLNSSVAGIGILPRPSMGASDEEVFDISVMGAKKNARAPYKVLGLQNFGRADMRIDEIDGWIPETHAASNKSFPQSLKNENFFRGLNDAFLSLAAQKTSLCCPGGLLDQLFSGATRRLIIRDTKTYGALQDDETHPDLLRDQIDREWLWDNLWGELESRPRLSLFIESELTQLRIGDIPYFYGPVDSYEIKGGDGSSIDLSSVLALTPLEMAKSRIQCLDTFTIRSQTRLAATLLGLNKVQDVTTPKLNPNGSYLDNALAIGHFIRSRIEIANGHPWIFTSYNPTPKASGATSINIRPCDPYLYDGISGIALFLHKVWLLTQNEIFRNHALALMESVFLEIDSTEEQVTSGFAGLSSVVYVANRIAAEDAECIPNFAPKIRSIVDRVATLLPTDPNIDFLLGISGTSCALLPYVSRSSDPTGYKLLSDALKRLLDETSSLLCSEVPIPGMLNLRGLSHGISGVALALYRLGLYFDDKRALQLAELLLVRESQLVEAGGWTDSHKYAGEALVGWCHGSAGISLALSKMDRLCASNPTLQKYAAVAAKNTISNGQYSSLCLCHGYFGNIISLSNSNLNSMNLDNWAKNAYEQLINDGFESLDIAQSLGIGMMTGLAGAGYYLLSKTTRNIDQDFMTLS